WYAVPGHPRPWGRHGYFRAGHRCRCDIYAGGMFTMALTFESPRDWGVEEAWRVRPACSTINPDLFFPVGVTGPAVGQIAAAKAVCAGCDVRAECLEFAIASNQEYGVWGGK